MKDGPGGEGRQTAPLPIGFDGLPSACRVKRLCDVLVGGIPKLI